MATTHARSGGTGSSKRHHALLKAEHVIKAAPDAGFARPGQSCIFMPDFRTPYVHVGREAPTTLEFGPAAFGMLCPVACHMAAQGFELVVGPRLDKEQQKLSKVGFALTCWPPTLALYVNALYHLLKKLIVWLCLCRLAGGSRGSCNRQGP